MDSPMSRSLIETGFAAKGRTEQSRLEVMTSLHIEGIDTLARSFDTAVIDAARAEREIELTTFDQVTNEPARVVLWITPIRNKLYLRSDSGMEPAWTKNLAAHGRGVLHISGADVPFTAHHVTDLARAKSVTRAWAKKYHQDTEPAADDSPTPAETATFELQPIEG